MAAGKVINAADGKIAVETKEGGSTRASQVVTEVDFQAQQTILEIIEPTLSKWDLALLSEERPDDGSRFEKEFFWAIDPLDGTLAFVEHDDGFAVSLALVSKEGIPQLGVVYDPVNDRLYEAIKGQGAQCNEKPLTIPRDAGARQCHFIVDRSTKSRLLKNELRDKLAQLINQKGFALIEEHTHFGAVVNICSSLAFPQSFFLKLPKKERGGGCIWDYGATACIYTEAGGVVTDCKGQRLVLNSPHSVYMNENGVLFATTKELSSLCLEYLVNT